jgi:hypothetical protein
VTPQAPGAGTEHREPAAGQDTGSGAPATGPAAGGSQPDDAASAAGRLLGRMSVLPALLLMAWLLAGLPLLLAGQFTPVLMLVIWVPLAAVLVYAGLRRTPGRWQSALPVPRPENARTPWWAVAGVLVVAVAFGVHQMIYHSEQIIVIRDPASYAQFGYWIAHHGSLPIPQARSVFGGAHHVLSFTSPAFFQVGTSLVPQFMAGLPMVLAAGFWIGGVGTAVAIAPVLGACGVLTFGGLVARLAGPRWAPLGALVLAVSLPQQFTSRSTYSEPLAQILFLGGLCLVIDSLEEGRRGSRALAALGGLALGLTLLVRIDGASDMLPAIPFCGMLLIGRRPQAVPLLGGLVAGALYGGIDGLLLSRPYLVSIKDSLLPLALVGGVVVIATAVAVAVLRDRGLPPVRANWLPNAIAVLAAVIVTGFAVRPYLQKVRGPALARIAGYQRIDHLPVDPHRMYYELALHWVFWYIGLPAVVLGTFAAVLLARRCLRGDAPTWTLPMMTFAWIIITILYRPAIVPDQPWASRRFVPALLPGFIVLAVWASGWLAGWLRRNGFDRVIRGGLVTGCAAVLLVPTALTSLPLAFKTTYVGEIAAVNRLCAAIPHGSAIIIISHQTARLTEVVRGMCGDPVARAHPQPGTVRQAIRGIERAGGRPVILAATRAELAPYGGVVRQIMKLRTTLDGHALTTPPRRTLVLRMNVWMWAPGP